MNQSTKNIGDKGEKLALDFLIKKGFTLVAKNYRYKRNEIDLIVHNDKLLVFVEVKFRSSNQFGFPEEFVDSKKMKRIKEAADHFLHEYDWNKNIRFDIVSIEKNLINHFTDIS